MDVIIVEAASGRQVARIPIAIGGINYTPGEAEYFSAAWDCAVEDAIVAPARRSEYTLQLVQPTMRQPLSAPITPINHLR